ncbi:MAG TPA: fibronectin type III domain-containing protein, partial [Polyangiaceae bacterium]|nr:fibronectin type III domain-containing protein [Polyangiaceae bacterium]
SQEEARMTVSMKRILAAVYPPENTAALVILAMAIVDKMDGNPYFPNPTPTFAKVTAAIDALRQAEAVSQSRMRGTVEVRNGARRELSSLLTRLKAYVQGVADDDPDSAVTIIESAGMSVQPKGPKAKPLLAARNGSVHGTVLLAVKAAAKLATYVWQMSEDGDRTWVDLPQTLQAKTKVSNLVPGRTYWFRYRALTRGGTSDASDPVSIIVQ